MKILSVYNTCSKQFEEIIVSDELHSEYNRSSSKIKNNAKAFYKHEIQFSALAGGTDGAYESFEEFVDYDNDPADIAERKELILLLKRVLPKLSLVESNLIKGIFFNGLSEREYARKTGIPYMTIRYRKVIILKKLKNLANF